MTDHIQQAATQQAQHDAQAELYEVQERLRLARRANKALIAVAVVCGTAAAVSWMNADVDHAVREACENALDAQSSLLRTSESERRICGYELDICNNLREFDRLGRRIDEPQPRARPTTLDPPQDRPAELTYDGKHWGVSYQDRHCTLTADGREVDCMPDADWSGTLWGDSSALTAHCRKTGAGLLDCGTVAK